MKSARRRSTRSAAVAGATPSPSSRPRASVDGAAKHATRPRRAAVALKLGLLVVLATALGCDGVVDARGRVVDLDGAAVAGARIILTHPGDSLSYDAQTDTRGCFFAGGMASPGIREYLLTVSAPGYAPATLEFENSAELAVRVALAPEGSGVPSAATPLADREPAELEPCAH